MKEEKKVLFIIHTEYHLLVTLDLIYDYYRETNTQIIIGFSRGIKNSRLRRNYDLSNIKNLEIVEFTYDEYDFSPNLELQLVVKSVLSQEITRLFFFQEHSPMDRYLAHQLKEKGATICLGSDGAKTYCDITKLSPRWKLRAYYWYHRFLIANKFYFWKMEFPSLIYANLKAIDEVWLAYPKKYKNRSQKKLVKVTLLQNPEKIKFVNQVFISSPDGGDLFFKNCIFYLNQNLVSQLMPTEEISLLTQLASIHPEKKLLIKLHPNTISSQIAQVKNIPNVEIFNDTRPAELIIANLQNSLVVSFWSTANLFFNPSCKSYWAFPILEEKGKMIDYLNLYDPTDHIIKVRTVAAIL